MDTRQQQRYPRPPGGPMSQIASDMPPQMLAPPGTLMMAPGYPSYPGMVMAGGPGMMPMSMAPMGVHPLAQMLADSARGGRASNVFYKTRLCNKWRANNCPFGDKCTYAHGQHELRREIPSELLKVYEEEQRSVQAAQPQQPVPPMPGGGDLSPTATDMQNKSQLYYKTKLCIRYMQTRECSKGAQCTFAHGYEDLRGSAGPQQASGPPLPGYPGGGRPYTHPQQPPTHMMMYPSHMMMMGTAGYPGGGPPGAHRGSAGGPMMGGGPRGGGMAYNNRGYTNMHHPMPIDRARGGSALVSGGDAEEETVAAANRALQSGEAFRGSAYADSAEDLVNREQGNGQHGNTEEEED